MSDKLEKYNSLPIQNMGELFKMGDMLAQSGMFGVKNAAGGMVIAATCHQAGITMLDYQRTYHTIDNKPGMRADAMAAEFRKHGGKYKIISRTPELAKAEFSFEGNKEIFEFSIEQAKNAGYCFKSDGTLKDNWRKMPTNMLWARMMSTAVRVLCPEIVAGLYTPEEIGDFQDQAPAQNEKPVRIKPKQKAEKEIEDAEVIDKPDFDACVDATTCPVEGKLFGVKWAEMDATVLEQALQLTNAEMTDKHRAQIMDILNNKNRDETH